LIFYNVIVSFYCAGYYFTGDGAKRDEDGYYWITGRVDDVINPSGHRIGKDYKLQYLWFPMDGVAALFCLFMTA
jgi:non-ribosomal peptide synthetase component E (peptide arylation enzyme)